MKEEIDVFVEYMQKWMDNRHLEEFSKVNNNFYKNQQLTKVKIIIRKTLKVS
jgi:hypothetical protein